ncbi:hypothetical protein [Streptococcus caballi]|uniref:hypothetical protein n=1 Tax=Streptococcus caballi TaxID=439220 RepID=UPI0012EA102F|nr:hypothetical protein [Streptococcus caballi]
MVDKSGKLRLSQSQSSELEEKQPAYQRLQAELTKLRQMTNISYHNKTTKLTLFLARL